MALHVRLAVFTDNAFAASAIERRLIGHFPDSITTVDTDPFMFRESPRHGRYDLA